jgi:hypothetical protein
MRRTGLWLISGAVAAVVVLGMGVAAPAPSQESSEIEQLKKEVAALRGRVEALEERLKESRGRPGVITPHPEPRQIPPNWIRREFNGNPYYICPIDTAHAAPNEATKQVPRDETPAPPKAADNISKR